MERLLRQRRLIQKENRRMGNSELLQRVRLRISDSEINDVTLQEYISTIQDRLLLRLGEEKLPGAFQSVCVDATVKMFRRTYYEGISSENVVNMSTTFVEDILSEYTQEISEWKVARANSGGGNKRTVKFL